MTTHPEHERLAFDLDEALSAMVSVRANIPPDGLTAPVLGTERAGNGVIVDSGGIVLTIGYLVTEAETLWVSDCAGRAVPGHVLGYDQETGFGLVQALQPIEGAALPLGESARVEVGTGGIVAGYGGREHCVRTNVIAKREFAGYWEYVLDEALFTAPAHPNWGGAALIGTSGDLLGIGSLLVQTVTASGEQGGANMVVPIDLLKPILEDLKSYGRPAKPPRPWLGMLVQDVGENLIVTSVYDRCPADRAGLRDGDVVVEVGGERVSELADMFRKVWSLGPAGVEVPLTIVREGQVQERVLESIDRNAVLKHGQVH